MSCACASLPTWVALLAEGVDRNLRVGTFDVLQQVALLAEGVDRNNITAAEWVKLLSRPPRGGRG